MILRRFLVLVVLMFWQGGFVFYSAVVVPVGRANLDPPALQSRVTLHVTRYLNIAGGVALSVLALDVIRARDGARRRKNCRWLCWGVMTVSLAVLFWLHPQLIEFMAHADRPGFYPLHRAYLWTGSVQWLFATIFAVLTLGAWRAEDHCPSQPGA